MLVFLSLLAGISLTGDSLTLSPISFTYHNFNDPAVESYFKNKILNNHTTAHPGFHLRYESGYFQGGGWFFMDSFGRPGGGLLAGPKVDLINQFWDVGVVGGIYARKRGQANPMKVPLGRRVGEVEMAPMAGVTMSVTIPVSKTYGIATSCMSNWLLTNCMFGVNIRW